MFTPHRPRPAQATRNRRCASRRACGWAGALLLGMAVCLPASADATSTSASTSTPTDQAATQLAAGGSDAAPKPTKVVPINISAAQAARAARNEYGGKVLDVRLEANDKAPYYRVRLLSGGRVQVVHVTAHE